MDTSTLNVQTQKHMGALEQWMAPLFAKFPHIPDGGRKTLADIAPWLSLIFGILGLLSILSSLSMASYFAFGVVSMMNVTSLMQSSMFIFLIAGLIASVLQILAFKPLKARHKKGWNLLFYSTVITTATTILSLLFGYSSFGGLIGALIGFWLLFEVRGLYQ